eukprot:CAMPEP_0194567018 /NCGR_PEP_ID=MMETSP0292-20121207/5652_1 /TAXON_ID=39354 /ORGANISM="Heterosigma akashiwo, Strain CCMP2393" /LENGTH=191 /DNA_ID=CAMNT_0039416685 /DNA_START=150 /DNA_END=722 /DNA_ORIENTATION=+
MAIGKITLKLSEAIIKQYGNLEKLNLSSNEITIIEDMSRLSSLKKLNLSNNMLMGRQMVKLEPLVNLVELNLKANRISLLEFFPQLPKLLILDLGNNVISDVRQIRYLHKSNPKLQELVLGGNPFTASPTSVLSLFQHLTRVDGRESREYGVRPAASVGRSLSQPESPRATHGGGARPAAALRSAGRGDSP